MAITVTELEKPTIYFTGRRVLADGSTLDVVDLEWDNTTSKDPSVTSFTINDPAVFVGHVHVKITTSYTLKDFPADSTETDIVIKRMREDGDQSTGNLLYAFTEKMPSPQDSYVYSDFSGQGFGFSLLKVDSYTSYYVGYVIGGEVTPISAAVLIEGKLTPQALAYVRLV